MSGRISKALLAAIFVFTFAAAAHAEVQVEIVVQDPFSGAEQSVASGTLFSSPRYLFRDSEYFLVDACGTAYEVDLNEKAVVPLQPELALQGLSQLSDGRVIYGFFDDGGIYRHVLNSSRRGRYDEFRRSIEHPELPQEFVAVTPTASGGQAYVVDEAGNLSLLAVTSDRVDQLRVIGQPGAWQDVTALVALTAFDPEDKSQAHHFVVSIDRSGRILRADLGESPQGHADVVPVELARFDLDGVRKLVIDSGENEPTVLALSGQGQAVSVGLFDGQVKRLNPLDRLAAPLALTYAYWHSAYDTSGFRLVYARSPESASLPPCPDKRALAARRESEKSQRQAAAKQSGNEAASDYRQLDELLAAHMTAFEEIHERRAERVDTENLLASRQLLLAELNRFEAEHVEALRRGIGVFQDRWGDGENGLSDEFRAVAEVVDFRWSGAHTEIVSLLNSYQSYRVGLAGALLSQASMHKALAESVDKLNGERKKSEYQESKRYAELALQFDPDSESGAAIASQVENWIGEVDTRNEAAIAAAQWPRTYPKFAGPGNPQKLADAALRWTNQKYDTDYLAAYVCGDWYVNQTNLLDEVLNYGIAMCMVRPDPDNSELGVISDVTLVTATARKEPAFRIAFFSDVTRISLDKADPALSLTASAGIAAGLIDLLLALSLVGCGLLLAPGYVGQLGSSARRLSDTLSTHRSWFIPLSMAVAVAAAMMLVRDPLSDTVAVLVAICASSLAWLQRARLPYADRTDARQPVLAIAGRALHRAELIGVTAIALGLIHLIFGRLPLI